MIYAKQQKVYCFAGHLRVEEDFTTWLGIVSDFVGDISTNPMTLILNTPFLHGPNGMWKFPTSAMVSLNGRV